MTVWRQYLESAYLVSDDGRVTGPSGRQLKPKTDSSGYPAISICAKGQKPKTVAVHRMVLTAFVGPRPDGAVTRHLDGDKRNNRLANLAYGTPTENNLDQVAHGVHVQSRKEHCAEGHPFTDANTYERPTGGRRCRECNRVAVQRYKTRRRLLAQHLHST